MLVCMVKLICIEISTEGIDWCTQGRVMQNVCDFFGTLPWFEMFSGKFIIGRLPLVIMEYFTYRRTVKSCKHSIAGFFAKTLHFSHLNFPKQSIALEYLAEQGRWNVEQHLKRVHLAHTPIQLVNLDWILIDSTIFLSNDKNVNYLGRDWLHGD